MKNFIKGALFIALIIPIIENLLAIMQQLTKHFCTWVAVKTYNLEQSIAQEEELQQTFAIGFQAPSNDEDYDEEEEGED